MWNDVYSWPTPEEVAKPVVVVQDVIQKVRCQSDSEDEDEYENDDSETGEKDHARRVDRMFSGKRVNQTKGDSAND